MPPRPVGACGQRARSSTWESSGPGAGSSADRSASWPTVVPVAAPCTACFPTRWLRSWRCTTSGARVDRSHRKVAHRAGSRPSRGRATRAFMALCAIACHFGRPGHAERPGLDRVALRSREDREPATARHRRPRCAPSRAGRRPLALQRGEAPFRHRLRLPGDEHEGKGQTIRKAREAGLEEGRLRRLAYPPIQPPDRTAPGTRRCWQTSSRSMTRTQAHVSPWPWWWLYGRRSALTPPCTSSTRARLCRASDHVRRRVKA